MNLREHWMMTGIRPLTERGLLPSGRATSGREDRLFATSRIANLRIDVFCKMNEGKCEQGGSPNHHAFSTFGISPAEQARMPKASGGR